MSINVTVNGNPISIRRGKMVLSDLENIKKCEKEHRKRLRLEQVQEQSRAISKTLLERARQAKKDQLDRLERDENTEMRRAHDRRLMEFHRRYQDIENIGCAHKNAAMQPDIESIRLEEERRNKALAKARGAEAVQRLQESKKAVSPNTKLQDRLRKVRDLENQRSCLVSQLPQKSCPTNIERLGSSENGSGSKTQPSTSTRKKVKCVVSKKSPIRKSSKHVKVHSTQKKTPRVSVSIGDDNDDDDLDRTLTEENACTNASKNVGSSKSPNSPKKVSDIFDRVDRVSACESDENEPRKTVPVTSSITNKPGRHGVEHYQDNSSDLTASSTTSSSSVSDDSSYFSDNPTPVNKAVIHHPSPASSKVSMYDHKTRQRKEYERPPGLVERINIKNVPNADELAQEIIELENKESAVLSSQKDQSRKRTNDAILREKIRRDYQALLKNLDLLSKEESKLKASQVAHDRQITAPSKTSENLARRQKKMDRAFENILRNSRDAATNSGTPVERPITITPRDYLHSNPTPANEWREPPYINEPESEASCSEEDGEYSRKRKISELLIKIEQLKRQLLQEYGPDLPDEVFNASVRSLFNNNQPTTPSTNESRSCRPAQQQAAPPAPPEIQVINMSSDENLKLARKIVASQCKKFISRPPPAKPTPKTSSTSTMTTRDQQIQVELEQPKDKAPHPIDPVVKIVTPENVDSSASTTCNSSSTDVVIDVSKKEVTLIPKNKKNNSKISKNGSVVSSVKSNKSVRRAPAKTPVKITFEQKKGGTIEVAYDPAKKEITVLPKKKKLLETPRKKESPIISGQTRSLPGSRNNLPSKKLSKSAPPSSHSSPKKPQAPSRQAKSYEEHRYREQFTQVSIDSSTSINSSSSSTTNHSFYSRYMTARRVVTKLQDTSDASTIYISPPTAVPAELVDDANGTRAAILELLNMDPSELRRRAQEVSPVSSPETSLYRTIAIPSNITRNSKISKNLMKFMSLIHAQTDTQSQTREGTTRTQTRLTQANARQSTVETNRTCNCRDPGCRLFHEKIEDLNQYTLKHCPEVVKKYQNLQQECTDRIASLTDLIEKVRSEQRGVDMFIDSSNGDSNTATQTQTIPSGQSTATSVNVNQLERKIDSLHAQLKQTFLESQKIIIQKSLESSKSPPPTVTIHTRDKSPSLERSKDTLTNDSLEVSAEKAKILATSTQHSTQQQQQQQHQQKEQQQLQQQHQPPSEKVKPKVLNSERVNIRLDHFRMSQGAQSTATEATAEQRRLQNENVVEQLSKEILEQSKSINKSVPPVDKSKDFDDDPLKSSQAPVKNDDESTENGPAAITVSTENDEDDRSDSLETSNPDYVPLLAGIPKMARKNSSNNGGRTRPPVTLISGPYRPEIVSPVHELSTIVEFDTPDTVNKSQISTRSPSNRCRKRLPISEVVASQSSSPTKKAEVKFNKNKPSVHVAPLPPHRSPQSLNASNKSTSKSIEKSPRKSIESPLLEKKKLSTDGQKNYESSDSLHTLPDVHIEEMQQSLDNGDGNYLRVSQISELHSIPDDEIDNMMISEVYEDAKSKSSSPLQKESADDAQDSDKGQLSSASMRSLSNISRYLGMSQSSTSPSSDLNRFKCPTSPEDLEEGLKKLGLNWALATLKKTREASALGSSSSSDVTPVNPVASRLLSPLKKSHQDSTVHDLPEVSDVSSISIKHANKSTDKSVLVKGRTSTPNRLLEQNSETNSSGTISTLDSFSSDAIQIAHDQSAEHSIPNISFK